MFYKNIDKKNMVEYWLTVMIQDKFIEHSATWFLSNITMNDLRTQFV